MNPVRRRALVLALGMGSTAALAAWMKPRPADPTDRLDLDALLPERFGDWRIDPESVAFVRAADRRGAQVRMYDQVLERTFLNDQGQRVMLSIAYGADQSADMQLHRPEVCYRAGGFEVGTPNTAALPVGARSLPVTRLVAHLPGRPEPITYWAVVGGQLDQGRRPSLRERLVHLGQRRRSDGLLVRLSSIDPHAEGAWQLHSQFAADMLQALQPSSRARLLGEAPHP